METPLFTRHSLGIQTSYSELKAQASQQQFLLVGSPGGITSRLVKAQRFLYRQFYDAEGNKAAEYIGPEKDPDAKARAAEIETEIEVTTTLVKDVRFLAQNGYTRVNARTEAVLSSLANGGVFRAGAIIVGSHAYGILLNELGVRAAAFTTQDVDVARPSRLSIATNGAVSFEELLTRSTVPLSAVPPLDRKGKPTSFSTGAKGKTADRLRVDLLAPTRGAEIETVAVPELGTHALGLPYLAYLLTSPLDAVALGRTNVIPLRVPRPERFIWHKALVSEQRHTTALDKSAKDATQAAVVFAVLADEAPDSIEDAFAAIPTSARTKTMRGAKRILTHLERTAKHPRACELMRELLKRKT